MSFILDALKKSEAERQRQSGPTLLELRVTRPRRRYPLWAVVVGVLLAANVVVLLSFVLRKPTTSRSPGAISAVSGQAPTAAPAPPPASAPAHVSAVPAPASAPVAAVSAPAPQAPADTHNPADDQPAVPASSVTVKQDSDTNFSNLPSIGQMSGHLPTLQLDLLDYSDRASERYALINMHRVHEGDVLPEGARVLAITREGVALSYDGQNFMLRPGGALQ